MTLSAQVERSLSLTGNPFENYGFITWEAIGENPAYYRLEVHELNWSSGDTISAIADRFEIWDKCFAKVPDAYLRQPAPFTQFKLYLQGYDSQHNALQTVAARLDGPSATKGCYWDCESSDFAYRIQQYDRPQGGWDYQFEMAYETEDEEIFLRIPYFRWFSPTLFNNHLGDNNTSQWHNYMGWSIFKNAIGYYGPPGNGINTTTLPHYQVAQQSINFAPAYWDNQGHVITSPQVRGIQKGFGQWFSSFWNTSTTRVMDHATDFCESTPDLSFMRQFLTTQLNINPALTCPPNLGGGGTVGGGLGSYTPGQTGKFDLIKYWRFEFVKKPLGSYGGTNPNVEESGTPLDREIVFFNEDNWKSRIADVFAFEEQGTVDERFTSILSESEIFVLERFDESRSVVLNGNFSTFFNADGTPVFPELNLTEGLYRLTVKRKEHAVFFIVFEVRYPFEMQVELKNYFDALLFPNPHTTNNIRANVTTTAALSVNYTLHDHMSNRLFSRNFNLPKDHSGEHAINFDVQLPNGFLYHKFTFADGSYKTYITVKQ